jgi:electron transfer flavoprotein beta subunit
MQAKKKPLVVKKLADMVGGATLTTKYVKFEAPPARKAGVKVKDVSELVSKLATEAKVI